MEISWKRTGKSISTLLTPRQIGVKFGAMYEHLNLRQTFRQHFFGMIVSVFEI